MNKKRSTIGDIRRSARAAESEPAYTDLADAVHRHFNSIRARLADYHEVRDEGRNVLNIVLAAEQLPKCVKYDGIDCVMDGIAAASAGTVSDLLARIFGYTPSVMDHVVSDCLPEVITEGPIGGSRFIEICDSAKLYIEALDACETTEEIDALSHKHWKKGDGQ